MHPFIAALQFLTILPVPKKYKPTESSMAQSLAFYPMVGLIIGVLLAGLSWALHGVPTLLSAALLLLFWVVLTGALHLDGLADSADAWLGGLGNSEKTLAIMKDPYCGPAGVVSIVLLLLLKFVTLHAIVDSESLTVLILAPVLGRTVLLLLFLTTPYVRTNGLAAAIVSKLPRKLIVFVFAATLLAVFLFAGINSLWLITIMLLVFIVSRFIMIRRIAGMTGDIAGALVEVTETSVLVCAILIYDN